jgi:hypothetical protein
MKTLFNEVTDITRATPINREVMPESVGQEEIQFESIGPDHELMKRKVIGNLMPEKTRDLEPKIDNIDKFGRRYRK